jgi:hypothetical protein
VLRKREDGLLRLTPRAKTLGNRFLRSPAVVALQVTADSASHGGLVPELSRDAGAIVAGPPGP